MGSKVWWIYVGGVIWCEMEIQGGRLVGVDVVLMVVMGKTAG